MKVCSNKNCLFAGQLQPLENFNKDVNKKDGLCCRCKFCGKQHYEKNKKEICLNQRNYNEFHKQEINNRQKLYYENHREERLKYQKEYSLNNILQIKTYQKEYRENNKDQLNELQNEYEKNRRKENLEYRIKCNLRSRLNSAIKRGYKSGSAVRDLCMSITNFKKYLEERFCPNPETG